VASGFCGSSGTSQPAAKKQNKPFLARRDPQSPEEKAKA